MYKHGLCNYCIKEEVKNYELNVFPRKDLNTIPFDISIIQPKKAMYLTELERGSQARCNYLMILFIK